MFSLVFWVASVLEVDGAVSAQKKIIRRYFYEQKSEITIKLRFFDTVTNTRLFDVVQGHG
jgi:hypothetical protein